jgi:Ti-type conjugative transfer relaxase TraA
MASYHLSAKMVQRSSGRSAAAYRSRSSIYDEHQGLTFDYTQKKDLAHSEILLPEHAPDRFKDRPTLWNKVEKVERRRDAQLAREIELALPAELTLNQNIELVREFVKVNFVDQGMIADINIHMKKDNPHVHILLTTREVTENGFGKKVRGWNSNAKLLHWREEWAKLQNQKLLICGHDIQVDHRSFADRGIELIPEIHLGFSMKFLPSDYLPLKAQELDRLREYLSIRRQNGRLILEDPDRALKYLAHHDVVFREKDIDNFTRVHTIDEKQFGQVKAALMASSELVEIGENEQGEKLYTTATMLQSEKEMLSRTDELNMKNGHDVDAAIINQTIRNYTMTREQEEGFRHMTQGGDIAVLVGRAGTGKSYTLAAVREAYEAQGFNVKGIALSGIAGESLQQQSGIETTTIYSELENWENGRDLLTHNDILVVDKAGIVGTRQMHEIIGRAHDAGAKVILVGDNEQLPPIEVGGAFRGIIERTGYFELATIQRQRQEWQKEATASLSGDSRKVAEALDTYMEKGRIISEPTLDTAKARLVSEWAQHTIKNPDKSTLILAYTNQDVFELNATARDYLKAAGQIAAIEYPVQTERGPRQLAEGERIIFLRNERSMGVKNGSLGTVLKMDDHAMTVRLDTGPSVSFDTTRYRDVDYGYATTIHKTQGTTVDRSFVLATHHFDKHSTYVAMSRHRDDVTLSYSGDHFKDFKKLKDVCGRERPKHLVADFAMPRGFESQDTAWAAEKALTQIRGCYTRDVTIDGKKYAVLEDFENKKEHLVPFKEEYARLMGFRWMQYDGETLRYTSREKSQSQKSLPMPGKELPGKELER